MIARVLLSLSALTLVAAADPQPAATTSPSIVPPPEVASNPENRLTLELSNGGTVVILLRPDIAPLHVERMRTLALALQADPTATTRSAAPAAIPPRVAAAPKR